MSGKVPRSLTKNGLWNLREEVDPQVKVFTSKNLILQIISVKELDDAPEQPSDQKKKTLQVKARYTISDGITSMKAIVSQQVFNKMSQKPQLYDIVQLDSFQRLFVKSQ